MHLMKAWTVQVTWRRSRFLSSEGILTSAGFLAPHKAAENCSRQKHETAKQCSNDVVTIEAQTWGLVSTGNPIPPSSSRRASRRGFSLMHGCIFKEGLPAVNVHDEKTRCKISIVTCMAAVPLHLGAYAARVHATWSSPLIPFYRIEEDIPARCRCWDASCPGSWRLGLPRGHTDVNTVLCSKASVEVTYVSMNAACYLSDESL
ncbi:hypothetical protein KC339_g84 [Hortaea werneckii]|nr:hypothetical protein KC339_g84 [Hortaea werneckii]